MQILDQAVEAIQKQGARARVQGAPLAAKLEAIAACGDQAARLWQGYLDNPGASGDKYTIVSWIGAERAKQLYELSLQAQTLVKDVCAATGDQARFLVLDESPIVLAYRGLREDETGPQAALTALTAQQTNNKHLHTLADKLRAIKPVAPKPMIKTVKKPAARKTVTKAVKKKVATKKKTAAGKPAVKKAARKTAKKAAKKK
jgi:hypothetical protein